MDEMFFELLCITVALYLKNLFVIHVRNLYLQMRIINICKKSVFVTLKDKISRSV